jgi:FdhD protein
MPDYPVGRWSQTAEGGFISQDAVDELAPEEPLAIECRFGPWSARERHPALVTLRTPGHDFDLARGWLRSERLVQTPLEILAIQAIEPNRLRVDLHPACSIDSTRFTRQTIMHAGCGLCGGRWLDDWAEEGLSLPKPDFPLPAASIDAMRIRLEQLDSRFPRTGGVHVAAAFTACGRLLAWREDIGRHNALDKLMGASWDDPSLAGPVVWLSSRAGWELVQKCVVARVAVLVTLGAPTSLAVEAAQKLGLTLIGFARPGRFNVYHASLAITAP